MKTNSEVTEIDSDEYRSRSRATFRFILNDVTKLVKNETYCSAACYVRHLPWILCCDIPRALTEGSDEVSHLGVFLECNGKSKRKLWSCDASSELKLIPQKKGVAPLVKKLSVKSYDAESSFWGYEEYISWNVLTDPNAGYIKNDTIILEASVSASVPTGLGWYSKDNTGYVGFNNGKETSYLNSILQTLYHTNVFRKNLYKIPVRLDSSKNVVLALQEVFHDLQISNRPVEVKSLWQSIGSQKQGVLDYFPRILDLLYREMEGKSEEGILNLFQGEMKSLIRCTNVDYQTERTEDFYDINLNVEGKKNIYESFEDFVKPQVLDGINKFDAGEYGLQKAEISVIFTQFPPVLYLNLMRFKYDARSGFFEKLNNRFDFPEKLDLSKFLEYSKNTLPVYTLHAVVIHSGDDVGDGFAVFVNPKGHGPWFEFDDDLVSACKETEAIDDNFGGGASPVACVLVYIRDSDMPNVLQDVTVDDISQELKERIKERKDERKFFITVRVILEDIFLSHQGNDLFDRDRAQYQELRVRKLATLQELMEQLSSVFKYPPEQLKLWPFVTRTNKTYRPTFLNLNSSKRNIHDIAGNNEEWTVFLELKSTLCLTLKPSYDNDQDVLLFFKLFDPKTNKMCYCGHRYVPDVHSISQLIPTLNEIAGFETATELLVFEEVAPGLTQQIKNVNLPIRKAVLQLSDGDILVFQKKNNEQKHEFNTCVEYFRILYNRTKITFIDKTISNDPGLTVELSLLMNYTEMVKTVAQIAKVDPLKLQFFKPCRCGMEWGKPISCSFDGALSTIFPNVESKIPKKIFYQKLTVPLSEWEIQRPIKVLWREPDTTEEKEMTLHCHKGGTVADLLELAKASVKLSPAGSGKLRLLERADGSVPPGVLTEEIFLETLPSPPIIYRLEEIPNDEVSISEDEVLTPVVDYFERTFSSEILFFVKVKATDTLSSIKEQVFTKLNIQDYSEMWKLFITYVATPGQHCVVICHGSNPTEPLREKRKI